MSYHVIRLGEPDERSRGSGRESDSPPLADVSSFSEVAGLQELGLREYTAAPGEQLPAMYHYHEHQEEGFYVIKGELHVETPDGTYTIPQGSLFVVEAGNPHRAFNPADAARNLRVLAIGAPTGDSGRRYEQ